ncbi:MAG: histidine kinase [Ferruginibacter sp.]
MFSRYQLSLLLLMLLRLHAAAQDPVYKLIPPKYELEHLKLNNKEDIGLFNDVIQDNEGYLWISGPKGLFAFDGNQTIVYKNGSKQYQLAPDSNRTAFFRIEKTHDGSLWIDQAFERLLRFDPVKRKYVSELKRPDPNVLFGYTAMGNDGAFFISGINRTKRTVFIWRKNDDNSLSTVFQIIADVNKQYIYKIAGNNQWLITSDKILRISLNGKVAEQYELPPGSIDRAIAYSDNTRLYLITGNQDAIYYWNEATNKIEKLVSLPSDVKNKIEGFVVSGNTIYLGSNLNFFIVNSSDNSVQDLSESFIELAKKEVPNSFATGFLKLLICSDSTLLACSQADIFRLKKKIPPEEQFREKLQAPGNISSLLSIRGLAEDDRKNFFVSYYTGVSSKSANENEFKELDTKKYLNSDLVSTYSLNYWQGNLLWNNVRIDLTTGKYSYLRAEKFSGHCTQYLHNDTLWFIVWHTNELDCYDLKRSVLTTYPIDKKMTSDLGFIQAVCDITGDKSGENLWISSKFEGISLLSKKGILLKQYQSAALASPDNDINELELVGDNLWYGCSGGLGVLNTVTEKATVYKNPAIINSGVLQNRIIFSILPDEAGNFYLGSNFGLLWFNTHTREFYNLAADHPLAKVEFNRTADFRSSDGRYYFGTTNGLYSFTKNELDFFKSSNKIKPINLNAISIFNSNDNAYRYLSGDPYKGEKLILDPFDRNIEFNFSVPEFHNKVYYSYRVKGQGDNWTDYNLDNKILLYSLQPGNYTLEVKASTGSTDENASYYSLPLEMKQVWYKQNWVIILFSLIAASLLIALLRYRFNLKLKRQKDLAALRTKISSDLHDDVGTILSGLAMQSQMLAYGARGEEKEQLNEISSMGRDAMEKMRDIVWAMDNRKDKIENLVDRMRAFAEKNLAMKNISHEFIFDNIDTKKFIDPEKRQAIYLIFKETITNIIKHSDAGQVIIQFSEDKDGLLLRVSDNGSKKPTSYSDGLGLSNMKMRAEKIGGTLSTKYKEGFVVEFKID